MTDSCAYARIGVIGSRGVSAGHWMLCEADVTSVVVRNGRRSDDVFQIDPSESTREAAGSALRNNLVLASAANL
jgi:hypothetical protein